MKILDIQTTNTAKAPLQNILIELQEKWKLPVLYKE